MAIKNDNQNFFTPTSFYNLNSAGLGVWITCLVIGSVFTDLSSFWFRIIALVISLIIALSFFMKNKSWHKPANYILVVVNSALIFINASGYNSITSSSPFERLRFKTDSIKTVGFINYKNQIDWWPDVKLINKNDSLNYQVKIAERKYEGLKNQVAFLKDWIQSGISDKKSRDTLQKILYNFGTYQIDTSDMAYLKLNHAGQIKSLNTRIDSLKQELKISQNARFTYTPPDETYTIGNITMSSGKWIDSLLEQNNKLNNRLSFARANSKLDVRIFDSLIGKY
jgi:chaperonin cofactor prefoldin